MLKHLVIQHIAIVERLELDFQSGLTVVTGETGAGKSILMDALHLLCGARSDSQLIQVGAPKAHLSGSFDLTSQADLKLWLDEQDLLDRDDPDSLIINRSLSRDGRGRIQINGQQVPLHQLRALGQRLLGYQSQHAQHRLMQSQSGITTLDHFHGHMDQVLTVKSAYRKIVDLQRQLKILQQDFAQKESQQELLGYQLAELEELNPQVGELEQLESERITLDHAEHNLLKVQTALTLCTNANDYQNKTNARDLIIRAVQAIDQVQDPSGALSNIQEMGQQCLTLIDELGGELQHYLDKFDVNPERLQWIEQRLNQWYSLARKHRCTPEVLPERFAAFQQEFETLQQQPEVLESLELELQQAQQAYEGLSNQLSLIRQQAATELEKEVRSHLPALSLPRVEFEIGITQQAIPSEYGNDLVEFWVRTNPGQPMLPLSQIASGGELARLFIALEVSCAHRAALPTLVFDEVDVGVGGATAERMGRLLLSLSQHCQVLCITHQPQVAALGEQHIHIRKKVKGNTTRSSAQYLLPNERVEELARMLGGIKQAETTLLHAKAMLELRVG